VDFGSAITLGSEMDPEKYVKELTSANARQQFAPEAGADFSNSIIGRSLNFVQY
jgi:hypothetical protein